MDIALQFHAFSMHARGKLRQDLRVYHVCVCISATSSIDASALGKLFCWSKAAPLPEFVRLGNLLHSRCVLLIRLVTAKGASLNHCDNTEHKQHKSRIHSMQHNRRAVAAGTASNQPLQIHAQATYSPLMM